MLEAFTTLRKKIVGGGKERDIGFVYPTHHRDVDPFPATEIIKQFCEPYNFQTDGKYEWGSQLWTETTSDGVAVGVQFTKDNKTVFVPLLNPQADIDTLVKAIAALNKVGSDWRYPNPINGTHRAFRVGQLTGEVARLKESVSNISEAQSNGVGLFLMYNGEELDSPWKALGRIIDLRRKLDSGVYSLMIQNHDVCLVKGEISIPIFPSHRPEYSFQDSKQIYENAKQFAVEVGLLSEESVETLNNLQQHDYALVQLEFRQELNKRIGETASRVFSGDRDVDLLEDLSSWLETHEQAQLMLHKDDKTANGNKYYFYDQQSENDFYFLDLNALAAIEDQETLNILFQTLLWHKVMGEEVKSIEDELVHYHQFLELLRQPDRQLRGSR